MRQSHGRRNLVFVLATAAAAISALSFPSGGVASRSDGCSPTTCYISLASPANGAVIPYTPGMTVTFTFSETFVCGGDCSNDQIEVKIATDQGLSGVVQDKYAGACSPQCPTSWTSQPFAAAGTYYWQVSTRGFPDINPVSPTWSFTLAPQSQPPPSGTTFHDAIGDASHFGYDVTDVTVVHDSQPNIHFTISVPSHPSLLPDQRVVIFFDSDLNSGTGDNGWDIQLCTCGVDNTQMRVYTWNGSSWPATSSTMPASLKASYAGGWSVDILARDLGLGSTFRFAIDTFQRNGGTDTVDDRAPDTGAWTYTLNGTRPAGCAPDATSPRVRALASSVPTGQTGHLRYMVSDNCGKTSDHIIVYSRSRVIARITTRLGPAKSGVIYYARWHVPSRPALPLKFCVVAFDAAENASAKSCARISVY